MTPLYLGVDCGTQGTKALIVDADGTVHGRGYAPHELMERAGGAREQEPAWWVAAMRESVQQALVTCDGASVVAMSVSGQQHGLVVLDEAFRVIRPAKLWNDTETAHDNEALVKRLGGADECVRRFGIAPLTGYTVSKLEWMRRCEPENFALIRHIFLPHEYLNWWLTGQARAEFGDASGTGYFNVRKRVWAIDVLDSIDGGTGHLMRALPAFVAVEELVGTLRPDLAAELGLPSECVVACGGGDNMMAAIGTANLSEGVVTLSLGTSSTVYTYSDAPMAAPAGGVAAFCSSSGGWMPLVCTMNATNAVTQTLTVLGKTVVDIESALAETEPGSGGLCFVPFLNGERTPDLPHATGLISGMTATNFTTANLIRAVIEGVSFGVLQGLRLILGDVPVNTIVVVGGGARSAAWRQLIADATGAAIVVPEEPEAGCLGAAIQAAYAFGVNASVAAKDKPLSMQEIAARCVKMDASGAALPRVELREAYASAKSVYLRAVAEIALKHV